MDSIQNWGEEHFVEYLTKLFPVKKGVTGIGDDSAVIPIGNGKSWLITTDALVEGVHFLKDQISAQTLGYKTVAVNVSDIAAMGAAPQYAFLSIALPQSTDNSWTRRLIDGIKEACDQWDILLLGGDTVGSKQNLFLSLTLIGSADEKKIKYRSSAQNGDIICVTNYLGDSGAGLKALDLKKIETEDVKYLIQKHFRPEPSPEQALFLASQKQVHAMMDISDGLDSDLKRLIKKSKTGAVIETSQLPVSPSLTRVALQEGWDPIELALVGGEDYCLLLTVDPEAFQNVQQNFQQKFHLPLFSIGYISDKSEELIYYKDGEKMEMNYKNYNHFQIDEPNG